MGGWLLGDGGGIACKGRGGRCAYHSGIAEVRIKVFDDDLIDVCETLLKVKLKLLV